jgi:SAM-dependent methyltransferase
MADSSSSLPHLHDQPRPAGPAAEFDEFAKDYDVLLQDPLRDLFASTSDFFHRRKWELIQSFLESYGLNSKRMAWLDVGCGRGELVGLAGDSFQIALGCDPSREMIGHGHGRLHWQPVQSELPFAAEAFDLVTAVCVFHHVPVPDRLSLVSEAFRVLRPNGVFCVVEHNPLNPITRWIVSRTPVDSDAILLSAGDTAALLSCARFQSSDTRYFLFAPEKLSAFTGKLERLLQRCPAGGQYAVFARKPDIDAATEGEQLL